MRRTQRIRPSGAGSTVLAVAGAMVGAAVLAGCGAGQITQTASQVSAVDGSSATVGSIAVRNARFVLAPDVEGAVAYPRGTDAPLEMAIVNAGGTDDALLSASSPVASSVAVNGENDVPGGQTLIVAGSATSEPTATVAATPSATRAAAASATPAAAASPSAEPSGSRIASVVLTGLRDDIRPGMTYEVVLTFQKAGPVKLAVPVASSTAPREGQHAE